MSSLGVGNLSTVVSRGAAVSQTNGVTIGAKTAVVIIYALIISDALTTVLFHFNAPFWRVSLLYKSVLEVFLLVVFLSRNKFHNVYLLLLFLVVVYIVGLTSLAISDQGLDLAVGFQHLAQYLLVFFMWMMFLDLQENSNFRTNTSKIMVVFFVVNNIAIFIGLLFDMPLFASYYNLDITWGVNGFFRFGFKGFINAINETTGVYFFGLAYFFREHFKKDGKGLFMLLSTVLAAFITGSKGCALIVLAFSFYYLLVYRTKRFFFVYLPVLCAAAVVIVPQIWDKLLPGFVYGVYGDLTPDWGLASVLLSGRDLILERCFQFIDRHWSIVNYFFGGTDLTELSSETDFFDGYFMFGIFFLVYLFTYSRVYFSIEKSRDTIYVFIIFLITVATGGHILQSAIVPTFLLIYVFTGDRDHGEPKTVPTFQQGAHA